MSDKKIVYEVMSKMVGPFICGCNENGYYRPMMVEYNGYYYAINEDNLKNKEYFKTPVEMPKIDEDIKNGVYFNTGIKIEK